MTTKPIDYIDAMPAADLRTNLRNAYGTTSTLNREVEMLHGLVVKQREQIVFMTKTLVKAQQVIENAVMAGCDDPDTMEHALAHHQTLIDIRTAIAAAKGGTVEGRSR